MLEKAKSSFVEKVMIEKVLQRAIFGVIATYVIEYFSTKIFFDASIALVRQRRIRWSVKLN